MRLLLMKIELLAPVTGLLFTKNFNDGDSIRPGDDIGSVESMKMIFPIISEDAGIIQYYVSEQELVQEGEPVAVIQLT
jgi:biotin carboxyl carrier protein